MDNILLDTRAKLICTINAVPVEIISGSISDSQAANAGLIFVRGNIKVKGSVRPSIGQPVDIKYDKYYLQAASVTPSKVRRQIQRGLLVIGFSVDPTKGVTEIEIGCRLTMLRNYAENKRFTYKDGLTAADSNLTDSDADAVTLPLSADLIASAIISKLGINGNPDLSNEFSVAAFDLSGGYVNALNDLLYSEGKIGYMKTTEQLEVKDHNPLTSATSQGIDNTSLIDIGPLSIGEVPPLKLIASYNYRTLAKNEEEDVEKLNWEKQESYGLPTTITIDNPVEPRFGGTAVWDVPDSFKYTYTPYTLVETTYDTYDRVVTRKTTERSIVAEVAPGYIQHIANKYVASTSLGSSLTYSQITPPEGSAPVSTITTQAFAYKVQAPSVFDGTTYPDGYEEIEREETVTEEPVLRLTASTPIYSFAGEANVKYDFGSDPDQRFVARREVRTYETAKGAQGQQLSKALTEQYLCHAYTQEGQQILADALQKISQRFPFDETAANTLFVNAQVVKRLGTSVEINSGREVALQQRPPQGERTAQGAESKQGSEELRTGTGIGEQTISIPYAYDDTFKKVGGTYEVISHADARGKKARKFLKNYFYYMLGLRCGVSVTTPPESLPPLPMTGVTIDIGGVGGGFMPTAITYTFDANGIVATADCLLAGGAQGNMGNAWFPVAAGISYTAPALTVTDTRPTIYLGQIATVGANAQTTLNTAYPTATSGTGVQAVDTLHFWVYNGSSWVDRGTDPAVTYPAYTPVPTTLLTPLLAADTTTRVEVQSLPYALALQTELAITSLTQLVVSKIVKVEPPLAVVSVAGNAPAVALGVVVNVPVNSMALTGIAPAVQQSTVVAAPAGVVAVAGLAPEQVGPDGATVAVPLATINLAGVAPEQAGPDTDTFFSSYYRQVYGWEQSIYPDWWAD